MQAHEEGTDEKSNNCNRCQTGQPNAGPHDQHCDEHRPNNNGVAGKPMQLSHREEYFVWGGASREELGLTAEELAVARRIAVWQSADVDVGHSIGTHQGEKAVNTTAASFVQFAAHLVRIARLYRGINTLRRPTMKLGKSKSPSRKDPPTTLPKW